MILNVQKLTCKLVDIKDEMRGYYMSEEEFQKLPEKDQIGFCLNKIIEEVQNAIKNGVDSSTLKNIEFAIGLIRRARLPKSLLEAADTLHKDQS